MNWQQLVVGLCLLVALLRLLLPVVRRWRKAKPGGKALAVSDEASKPTACGSCQGCDSGGCH